MNQTIDSLLMNSQLALTNVRTVEALSLPLGAFGYNSKLLNEGDSLLTTARSLAEKQKKEYGEQYEATQVHKQLYAEVYDTYISHLRLARIVFEDDLAVTNALTLRGSRKKSISGLISQVETFYDNILSNKDWTASFSQFNITKKDFVDMLQKTKELEHAYAKQKKETGEAQKATQERDEAIDALADWYGRLIKVARIALKDDPQLLEMLGIISKGH